MALKRANMVKRIIASGGGTLEAKSGESIRIRRVECVPSANDSYLTFSVERVTVGFYRVRGKAGNHLGTKHGAYLPANIMDFLSAKGINVSIPVAEGQTFAVSRYAEAGNVIIVYDLYDGADVKPTEPQGTLCNEYTFLQYCTTSQTPTAAQDVKLDTSLTPAEFPDFPCGAVVPAGHAIELLGIAGSPFIKAAAGPVSFASTFLKLLKDREILFDQDRNGIPFDGQAAAAVADSYAGNFSLVGPGTEVLVNTNIITPGDPMILTPAILFTSGAELNAFITLAITGAGSWAAAIIDLAFILKVKKV